MSRRRDSVQQRCASRLAALGLDPAPDIDAFLSQLAAHRGRPLERVGFPAAPGTEELCGAWVPLGETDFIFYEEDSSSSFFRDHTVLHECAHIIWGHQPSVDAALPWLERVFPDLDERLVRGALFRHDYEMPEEVEADAMATIITAQLDGSPGRAAPAAPADRASSLDRLARALGTTGA